MTRRIAVLTSGGDAPGMNAAIRAVVRTALSRGATVSGVRQGYAGLIRGDFFDLGARDVGGILQLGGTFLGSARCPEFKESETQSKAARVLSDAKIDGLVVIGGNGSQAGASSLAELGVPLVGVASTIDNDLHGSDITLGVDSALHVAVEAIDRLRTTASSHHRAFLLEVMGRDSGYLALRSAIAGGAEAVVLPEIDRSPDDIAEEVRQAYGRGKTHAIVVVAEGARHNASDLAKYFREHHSQLGFDLRATVLGHVQRGAAPSVFDRLLGSELGSAAAESLLENHHGVLVGRVGGVIAKTPLSEVATTRKQLDLKMLDLAKCLAQ